jgi:predicted MFS family arabinose efflux permease
MAGLALSTASATVLTLLAWFGLASPWVLLGFCVLAGAGVAIYSPAWQSSIGEQVAPAQLPAAIALGTISYNLGRSFGPAIGGIVVLVAGAQAAFAINAAFYLTLLVALVIWRRKHVPSRLPPERIDRAIIHGVRFVLHSSTTRKVLMRSFLFGLVGATGGAFAPMIAKDLMGDDASIFGLLLGASGAGAIAGAFLVGWFHARLGIEHAARLILVVAGGALILVGFSSSLFLTCLAMFIAGGAKILTIALFNIAVQVGAPRWVTARALSLFSASLTGAIAIGAALWGLIASQTSVEFAVIASGVGLLAMDLTMRSGPIVISVEYQVESDAARSFYDAMLQLQRVRLRNGSFNWSLARVISDPHSLTERFQFPTWGDYLRTRDRYTQTDLDAQALVDTHIISGTEKLIRRRLERPFGSVRWQQDTPDTKQETINYVGP